MNETEFRDRVIATLHNPAGQRHLVDHVSNLFLEISTLRADGVNWLFIAAILHQIRRGTEPSAKHQDRYCGQVRSAYSKLRKNFLPPTGRDPPISSSQRKTDTATSQSINDRIYGRKDELQPKGKR